METNTSEFLPFDCISHNLLIDESSKLKSEPSFIEGDEFYMNGTGFFCQFPPYDDIFYITAKHCLMKEDEDDILKKIKIPYDSMVSRKIKAGSKVVMFSDFLLTSYTDEASDDKEDIVVLIVDKNINESNKEILKKRSINLVHQYDVDNISSYIIKNKKNIRTMGFPKEYSDIKYHYNDEICMSSVKEAKFQIRGFYGKMVNDSKQRNRYGFTNTNWKDGYNGFSGAPIFALIPDIQEINKAVVIGVVLTAGTTRGEFLSINVATNLIAEYLESKGYNLPLISPPTN